MQPYGTDLFSQHNSLEVHSGLFCVLVVCSRVLLSSVSWCGCATVCVMIHPLNEEHLSSSQFAAVMNKAVMNICRPLFVCEDKSSFLWDKCPGM